MQFVIKYFAEITIKSKPVRRQFVGQLRKNLSRLLKSVDPQVQVEAQWDKLMIETELDEELVRQQFIEIISNTPGIAYFLDVVEYPLVDIHDVYEKTLTLHGASLAGKTFVVRCKRVGQHDFKSGDVEQYVGGGLNQNTAAAGVDLRNPDITVRLEIRGDRLFIVNQRYQGLGGFPMGALDPVLSLMSGGFDSTVASYLTMKRGLRTHFLFFNLGGHAHEVGVKEVSLYLWQKYAASHRVKFIAVPFEDVVGEILQKVDNSQMGVILKRMMLRAGSRIAAELGVQALVTGESVAQVSSQTLTNLAVIDSVTDTLVLRPLITSDKTDIIRIAARIGTEEFAANMPEYCGVISVKPTTKARPEKIEREESKFDFDVLERAIADARSYNINEIDLSEEQAPDVESLAAPLAYSVVVDVRHPGEQELKPLNLASNEVMHIPFYELHRKFAELDMDKIYMLYCDKGVMSRLHASHLKQEGYDNVRVYRPSS
ncbi:MAG: tRNA uracil 4-sulfurtransferase ThiI [Pseudomonadales bacterium]